MQIPKKGEPVSPEKLIKIAITHGHYDIVDAIRAGTPDDVFVSDGCSMWPDSWMGDSIYEACFFHDIRYWLGGSDEYRLFADTELARDVARLSGNTALARTMFVGVSAGGQPEFGTPFRWGYGRP